MTESQAKNDSHSTGAATSRSRGLTEAEEQELRSQTRTRLESESEIRADNDDSNAAFRQAERRRIAREEEDAYYAEKGLYRYRNHRGEYEWLTQDQVDYRKQRRRYRSTSKKRNRFSRLFSERTLSEFISGLVVLSVVVVSVLVVIRALNANDRPYALEVLSEPPGAAIFVNGKAADASTNTIVRLSSSGRTLIVVALPGYHSMSRTLEIAPEPVDPPPVIHFRLQTISADSVSPNQ